MKQEMIKLLQAYNSKSEGIHITVDLNQYVEKLLEKAKIIAIHGDGALRAFLAYYDNDPKKDTAFVSMLLVSKEYQGQGIAKNLMDISFADLKRKGFKRYNLEVLKENSKAVLVYEILGFKIIEEKGDFFVMEKSLG